MSDTAPAVLSDPAEQIEPSLPVVPPEEIEGRVEEALRRLDLAAKVRLLTGRTFWRTRAEPAIGLRAMVVSDGPAGVRGEHVDERDPAANLPCATAVAASWDEQLAGRLGALLGADARRKGVDAVLAPTVNLHRSPLAGRNFECYSEDPLLSARIGAAMVRGVQSAGVGATVKHYVANDAETERFTVDVRVGERVLRELYLAPFEHIVAAAAPWLVMASYNSVNGVTMTESPLLAEPLLGEWAFDGVVVSDWFAARSTEAAGRGGLGLIMPGPGGPWGPKLIEAVESGAVPPAAVDDKVRRLLRLAVRVGALAGPGREGTASDSAPPVAEASGATPVAAGIASTVAPAGSAGAELLRAAAAAGTVLLRNTGGLLPLDAAALRRVAVLGPNATAARTQGAGSAGVPTEYAVSPLAGLRAALPPTVALDHGVGARMDGVVEPLTAEQMRDPVTGEPGLRVRLLDADGAVVREEHRYASSLRWLDDPAVAQCAAIEADLVVVPSAAGRHEVGIAGLGLYRLEAEGFEGAGGTGGATVLLDGEWRPEDGDTFSAFLHPPARFAPLDIAAGGTPRLRLRHELAPGMTAASFVIGVAPPSLPPAAELDAAAALAAGADVAVVVVGTGPAQESEGFDRATLALPDGQDELVRRVAAANPRTIVVVNAGSPVALPWRDEVAAVLVTWFPGQEAGHALADVLLGLREPGGRLPTTWPATGTESPVLSPLPSDGVLAYQEGLDVGYRAWARAGVPPAYPFGAGLGYTTWQLTGLDVPARLPAGAPLTARVGVRNTGGRRGRHVVQAYLRRPDSTGVPRPPLWLAGFAAVDLDAGAAATVEVDIAARAFAHWAEAGAATDGATGAAGWTVEPGAFELLVGSSSADLPLAATVAVVG